MCDIMEQYNQEAVDKFAVDAIRRMAKSGTSVKDLANGFQKTEAEVEAILDSSED